IASMKHAEHFPSELVAMFFLALLTLNATQNVFAMKVDRGAFVAQPDRGIFAGNYTVTFLSNSSLIPIDWSHDGTFVTAVNMPGTGVYALSLNSGNVTQLFSTGNTYKLRN